MDNTTLATKIKELRKRNGFSQEQLAEESMLSLRTVQRIESGESVPRGDTLTKLTAALKVRPDDVLEWAPTEDRGYLTVLNLGGFGFLINPFLGIVIPLVMWILKKDKIKLVDDTGRKLISFQLTWTIMLYATMLIATEGKYIFYSLSFKHFITALFVSPSLLGMILTFLYFYNIAIIALNVWRSRNELKSIYVPAIPFLK
ncbi:DUF4870 domain-containing protein [Pontibacter diazotrophicus]|uniref:DUF4870 domain-containing protein n=1 Tax=Pontibacter diazotrophicus TaxID=1400979 RepID=A0A3D8L8V3_9BACT|nr:helix-turn-helix domain-containing protein [Pontibacter diazotrophicus]RDV13835.1 DUF4870 domain-containing protein [Pontibacter diazotrophicus]